MRRPQQAAVAVLLAASAFAVLDPPVTPKLAYGQTPDAVTVTVTNDTSDWVLTGRRVRIIVRGETGNILIVHGPDLDRTHPGKPPMHCCVLPTLQPGQSHTFVLYPVDPYAVAGITMRPQPGGLPLWVPARTR